ncbi:RNB-like protein [Aphelenchoides avenae]|nr:RNB-like protein [Aphelenchus avenae]
MSPTPDQCPQDRPSNVALPPNDKRPEPSADPSASCAVPSVALSASSVTQSGNQKKAKVRKPKSGASTASPSSSDLSQNVVSLDPNPQIESSKAAGSSKGLAKPHQHTGSVAQSGSASSAQPATNGPQSCPKKGKAKLFFTRAPKASTTSQTKSKSQQEAPSKATPPSAELPRKQHNKNILPAHRSAGASSGEPTSSVVQINKKKKKPKNSQPPIPVQDSHKDQQGRPPKAAPLTNGLSQKQYLQPCVTDAASTVGTTTARVASVPLQNGQLKKPTVAKAHFTPYLSEEEVLHGLEKNDLIKGTMRVNQRNYDEAYIDNPEGDDQMGILIRGLRDRNRALHGDVVVVRLKDRSQWVVRDSLHEAWRNGELNVPCDYNEPPMTVLPKSDLDCDDEQASLSPAPEPDNEDNDVENNGSRVYAEVGINAETKHVAAETVEVNLESTETNVDTAEANLGLAEVKPADTVEGSLQSIQASDERNDANIESSTASKHTNLDCKETNADKNVEAVPVEGKSRRRRRRRRGCYTKEELLGIRAEMMSAAEQMATEAAPSGSKKSRKKSKSKKAANQGQDRKIHTAPVLDSEILHRIQGLRIHCTSKKNAVIDDLALKNTPASGTQTSTFAAVNSDRPATSAAQPKRTARRQNYKMLAEFPDHDCGMPDVYLQKTAEVVYISEEKNSRTGVGHLKPLDEVNRDWALFHPADARTPRMLIAASQVPRGFFQRPQDFSNYIFVAKITRWPITSKYARGKLQKQLGLAGDIEAETEGLLISNEVDTREFSDDALASLPITDEKHWKIDEKEFEHRRDFRKEVIFTIDPLTARDLDDALHIKRIDDCDGKGTPGWEVGVHIADVSYFVQMNAELDKWARQRATSVYLVHKVIPMLPRILCEQLCSLNPGVERLTFSVVWKMNDEAEIQDTWFGRSVISSCTKLAYEHAQDVIHHPNKTFKEEEFPERSPNVSMEEINTSIHNLHYIAKKLKEKRIANGSLRLDLPKLKFSLDSQTGMPIGVTVGERKDANYLVEEFMLMANMSVAKKIEQEYPQVAVLRRHPAPKQKILREVVERCRKLALHLDANSSSSLAESLDQYAKHPEMRLTVFPVVVQFIMKAMQRAVYFCTGTVKSQADYHHYGLSVPFYTHFTSPIRRYPDLMVHRLLAAALGYASPPEHTPEEVEKIAGHCNDRKECGRLETVGVVVVVLDAAFDVLLLKYGIIKRVYANTLKLARQPILEKDPLPVLTLRWDSKVFDEDKQDDRPSVATKSSTDQGTAKASDSNEVVTLKIAGSSNEVLRDVVGGMGVQCSSSAS